MVMGDNRENSRDSRFKSVGFIDRDYLEGKAVFRLWPLNKIGNLK
jgi:signal peptidase I